MKLRNETLGGKEQRIMGRIRMERPRKKEGQERLTRVKTKVLPGDRMKADANQPDGLATQSNNCRWD
jgi:hypothetical protein